MRQQVSRPDEEQQALYLREAVLRRRQIIEQQIAIYGPLNMPPHLQVELEYQNEELTRLDKRLTNARRRKKREDAMQQVVSAAGGFKQLLLPAPRPLRRRRKGFITRIQIWLARLGLAVVLVTIIGVMLWWQGHTQSPSALTEAAGGSTSVEAPALSPSIGSDDRRVVANTRGLGVRFRQAPQQDAPSSIAILEGTAVHVIEQLLDPDGEAWWKVRLDDGTLGYIKDRYLVH
jgi:hypothetical protein